MVQQLTHWLDPHFLAMVFAAIAAAATVLTLAMPYVATDTLSKRMKAVALEREKIRQRERERLAQGGKITLRQSPRAYMKTIVENFNLSKWVGQEEAHIMLVQAGYRGQAPYVTYLFFRMVMPITMLILSLFYVFVVLELHQPPLIKIGISIGAAYFGMLSPNLFLKNKIQRRQLSIKRAFPDALDLLLICVESGMSIEAAFRKVSEEIGAQSVALAEELTLTTAELSYLPIAARPTRTWRNASAWKGCDRCAWLCSNRNATARRSARPCGCWRRRIATCACPKPRRGRRRCRRNPRADDLVLPAGAVHRHSRSSRDPRDGAAALDHDPQKTCSRA